MQSAVKQINKYQNTSLPDNNILINQNIIRWNYFSTSKNTKNVYAYENSISLADDLNSFWVISSFVSQRSFRSPRDARFSICGTRSSREIISKLLDSTKTMTFSQNFSIPKNGRRTIQTHYGTAVRSSMKISCARTQRKIQNRAALLMQSIGKRSYEQECKGLCLLRLIHIAECFRTARKARTPGATMTTHL